MSKENHPQNDFTGLGWDGYQLTALLPSLWDARMWTLRDRGYVSTLPLALGKASLYLKMEPAPSSHPLLVLQPSTTGRGKGHGRAL